MPYLVQVDQPECGPEYNYVLPERNGSSRNYHGDRQEKKNQPWGADAPNPAHRPMRLQEDFRHQVVELRYEDNVSRSRTMYVRWRQKMRTRVYTTRSLKQGGRSPE